MKKTIFFTIVLVVGLINIGFSQTKSYDLKFNPKDGARYVSVMNINSTLAQNISGQDMTTKLNYDIGMFYDIASEGENKKLTMTYDKLKMNVEVMGQNIVMDSEDADTTKAENKAFRSMKGAAVSLILQPNGKILRIDGANELLEKVKLTEAEKQTIKGILSEDALKTMIEQSFSFYPAQPVKQGDTWKTSITIETPYKLFSDVDYSLKSVTGNNAAIDFVSTLSTKGSQKMTYNGMDMTVDLAGDMTGTTDVDIRTGMPATVLSNMKLKGNIEVMGNKIPMAVIIDTKMTVTQK